MIILLRNVSQIRDRIQHDVELRTLEAMSELVRIAAQKQSRLTRSTAAVMLATEISLRMALQVEISYKHEYQDHYSAEKHTSEVALP